MRETEIHRASEGSGDCRKQSTVRQRCKDCREVARACGKGKSGRSQHSAGEARDNKIERVENPRHLYRESIVSGTPILRGTTETVA